ncbi:MAG: magnesium transporter [Gammaproteobacteria bacterium]
MQHNEEQRTHEILKLLQETMSSEHADDIAWLKDGIKELHPSEIADLLESLPSKDRENLWELIGSDLEGEVLSHAQDGVRSGLLEQMQPHEVAAATENLETDDATDIIQDLAEDVVDEVLGSMDEHNRIRLEKALSYPEDTAGGLMNTLMLSVYDNVDLGVVMRYLRMKGEVPEKSDSLVVVDRNNHYQGMLPLVKILTSRPEELVSDVMSTDIEAVPTDMSANEIAKLFEQRDLYSVAVTDEENTPLGRITIDDVVDVIRDQGDHSLMSMAGMDENDDMFAPIVTSAKRRALWLGINLATAFLAASVIGRFAATIEQLVALAVLMPIVASMGGIAGSQTLTVVIRGLAMGHLGPANSQALLLKEIAVGLINGFLWASVVGVISALWFNNQQLGLVIASAMIVNLFVAAFFGAVIPLWLKKREIDPALAGGVILTTVTDVIGFLVFLGLASIFLM